VEKPASNSNEGQTLCLEKRFLLRKTLLVSLEAIGLIRSIEWVARQGLFRRLTPG
jgi:hypothetical protein